MIVAELCKFSRLTDPDENVYQATRGATARSTLTSVEIIQSSSSWRYHGVIYGCSFDRAYPTVGL